MLNQVYSLNYENIERLSIKIEPTYSNKEYKKKKIVNTESTLFSPYHNDKLFWIFYILKNGIQQYNLIGKNHFFIESKYLVAKFTNTECRKRVCSNRSNCFFVPNYPIFTFEENEYWKPIDEFEDYLNIHF